MVWKSLFWLVVALIAQANGLEKSGGISVKEEDCNLDKSCSSSASVTPSSSSQSASSASTSSGSASSDSLSLSAGGAEPTASIDSSSSSESAPSPGTVQECRSKHYKCMETCRIIEKKELDAAESERQKREQGEMARLAEEDKREAEAQKKRDQLKKKLLEAKIGQQRNKRERALSCQQRKCAAEAQSSCQSSNKPTCEEEQKSSCEKEKDGCNIAFIESSEELGKLSSLILEIKKYEEDYAACLSKCRTQSNQCESDVQAHLSVQRGKLKRFHDSQVSSRQNEKSGGTSISSDQSSSPSLPSSSSSSTSSPCDSDCQKSRKELVTPTIIGDSSVTPLTFDSNDKSGPPQSARPLYGTVTLPPVPPPDRSPSTVVLRRQKGAGPADAVIEEADLVIKADEDQSRRLTSQIQSKENSLDAQNSWMDSATTSLQRLKRMIATTNVTMTEIRSELQDLRDQKHILEKKMAKDVLERDLRVARISLVNVLKEETQFRMTGQAILSRATQTQSAIDDWSGKMQKLSKQFDELMKVQV